MVGALLIPVAFAQDCTIQPALDRARDALLSLEIEAGEQALDDAKDGVSCGAVPADELARYWLLTATAAEFAGTPERVPAALVAARASDPTVWIDALGADLRARWEAATPAEGRATIELLDLPEGYAPTVDGRPLGDGVAPGLHVVQARAGGHGFGRVVRAGPDDTVQLDTGLPARPVAPVPEVVPPPSEPRPAPPRERVLALHLAGGVGVSLGDAFAAEPAVKVGPRLEVGVSITPVDPLWIRVAFAGDVLIGGTWSYSTGGEEARLPVAPSLLVAVGARAGRLRVGALSGQRLPGRLPVRALVAVDVIEHVAVEARVGVDSRRTVGGDSRLEPALGVLATVTF